VGGSNYEVDGVEYLKVIGETYDGTVYTGEVKVENGTPIVGRSTAASAASGFFLPKNTRNKNYDAAFKFASWAAGPEGQKIIAKGNTLVPNQMSYALSKEFTESPDRAIANMWAGSWIAQEGDIGDYTYFTTSTWIVEWSQTFNNDVRKGLMTLQDFLAQKQTVADNSLKNMRIRILGR
jgi:ABC-type glycerol-3-phosphate transport system substrate-binding protein